VIKLNDLLSAKLAGKPVAAVIKANVYLKAKLLIKSAEWLSKYRRLPGKD